MDKPKCKLCGERHWSGEGHKWPAAVPAVDVRVKSLHRPLPGMGPAPERVASKAKAAPVVNTPPAVVNKRDLRSEHPASVVNIRSEQRRPVVNTKPKKVRAPRPVPSMADVAAAIASAPVTKTDGKALTQAERDQRYKETHKEAVRERARKRMAAKRAKANKQKGRDDAD